MRLTRVGTALAGTASGFVGIDQAVQGIYLINEPAGDARLLLQLFLGLGLFWACYCALLTATEATRTTTRTRRGRALVARHRRSKEAEH